MRGEDHRAAARGQRTGARQRVARPIPESKTFKERYRSYVDRLGQALATERAAAGAPPRNDDEKAHLEGGGDLHRRGTVPCRVGRSTDRHRLVLFVQRVVRGGRLGPWR